MDDCVYAESTVLVRSLDGDIGADWYKMSDLNRRLGALQVRPAVHAHRGYTGQHRMTLLYVEIVP
jgi:hypothetical protein